jgi:hypothetical protein
MVLGSQRAGSIRNSAPTREPPSRPPVDAPGALKHVRSVGSSTAKSPPSNDNQVAPPRTSAARTVRVVSSPDARAFSNAEPAPRMRVHAGAVGAKT